MVSIWCLNLPGTHNLSPFLLFLQMVFVCHHLPCAHDLAKYELQYLSNEKMCRDCKTRDCSCSDCDVPEISTWLRFKSDFELVLEVGCVTWNSKILKIWVRFLSWVALHGVVAAALSVGDSREHRLGLDHLQSQQFYLLHQESRFCGIWGSSF